MGQTYTPNLVRAQTMNIEAEVIHQHLKRTAPALIYKETAPPWVNASQGTLCKLPGLDRQAIK